MPDPAAKDPHTAVFDRDGTMWFTLQNSNMLGRLIPVTGDIKLVTMPIPKAKPYGIKLDSQDVPWFACNGSNCIGRIDKKTMATKTYPLPPHTIWYEFRKDAWAI
jgi:virginiamycin B lyase